MLIVGFICVLLISFLSALQWLRPGKSQKAVQNRLHTIATAQRDEIADDLLGLSNNEQRGISYHLGKYAQQFDFSDKLQLLIVHAGSQTTVGSVIVASLVAAFIAASIVHLISGSFALDVIALLIGLASRWCALKFQASRRLKKFTTKLPDAIELLARALRAGHSINAAIEIVSEQSEDPLGSEFAIAFQQQKFGIPFRDAILQLAGRVPSKDLHFLVTAVLVQKETGGDLTEILDRTTRVIRERIRIEGEVKTYTAQGRLTGCILGALPILMLGLINFVTPGYSHILFYDPLGKKLLYAGATLIFIGGMIIRKIVDIKV